MGDYPQNWKDIAHKVKSDAEWRCIRCQHPHERPGKHIACDMRCKHTPRNDGKQRVLTVHHLDGDKANCRWWNLVALCQGCHLQIQAKVVMSQRWPFEHSKWFKPYVAGWNAFNLLGKDLTRDEAVADLERLLSL